MLNRFQNILCAAVTSSMLLTSAFSPLVSAAQPGSLNTAFSVNSGLDAAVNDIAIQSDGKILITGDFQQATTKRPRITRLLADGNMDPSFDPKEGFNSSTYAVAVQGDGKILVGGAFGAYNGVSRSYLARLNGDGSLDETFPVGSGPNQAVIAILVLPSGDILVGGSFGAFDGEANRAYLVKLKANGALDSTFSRNLGGGGVYALAVQLDGKILIGGDFTFVGSQPRNRIARLNSDGTLDRTFDPVFGPTGTVWSVVALPDGKMLIGGAFGLVNGAPRAHMARLHSTGLPDLSFNAVDVSATVSDAELQSDGRIVVGGSFAGGIMRLRANGERDKTFTGSGANSGVYATAIKADGNILLGGSFTRYDAQDARYLAEVTGLSAALGGTVEFQRTSYEESEGQADVTLEVRRSGDTSKPVSVNYETVTRTATTGDYNPQSGTLSFASGETRQSIVVPILADQLVENNESFAVTLSDPIDGAELGSESTALVTIMDDDVSDLVGALDTKFVSGGVSGAAVNAVTVAPDGKIYAGGAFWAVNGQSRLYLARLGADGDLDPAFSGNAAVGDSVSSLAVQADGKVLVGGGFRSASGIERSGIARFNLDGTLDQGFNPGSGVAGTVYSLAVQPSGEILIGGSYASYNGEGTRQYLVQVSSDGSIDGTFNPQVKSTVLAIAIQPDRKIIIAGDFTEVRGEIRNRIARLNRDGTLDATFDSGAGADGGSVRSISLLADGNMIIGGSFGTVNGGPWSYLARLHTNGLPDVAFSASLNGAVFATAVQPDGRIIVGGQFTSKIVRLRSNGRLDTSFSLAGAVNQTVYSLALQANGDILAAGAFTEFAELARTFLVRVHGRSRAAGGELELSAPEYSVSEADGRAVIEVRRSGQTNTAVSVDFSSVSGTANAGDYTPRNMKLNFAPGENRKTVEIPIRPDPTVEDDEAFEINLSNPTGGAELGSQRSATVKILNDDAPGSVGALDPSFGGSSGFLVNTIFAIALGADGKITIGGDFRAIVGQSRYNLARLESTGVLDPGFNPALWFNGEVYTISIQEDGKAILAGSFTTVVGKPHSYLVRINQDGFVDESFNSQPGPDSYVYATAFNSFDDIYVGGSFARYNGESRPGIVRVFSDGSLDTSFSPKLNSTVFAIAVQPDEKILIAGDFTLVAGQPRHRIARLNVDGSLDPTFLPGSGADARVRTLSLQTDGKVIIGGSFGTVNGAPYRYIARLHASGQLDTSFNASSNTELNGPVVASALQQDGRILIGGDFSSQLMRLRSNGSNDLSFSISGPIGKSVYAVALQSDGHVLAGGTFDQFAAIPREGLARVQGLSAAIGGEVEFGSSLYKTSEANASVTVEVLRYGNTDSAITVDFATGTGTATAGDYVPQSNRLIFGANETRKTITIPIRPDTLPEDQEFFDITLANPSEGAELGSERIARIAIQNDDFPTAPGTVDMTLGGPIVGGSIHALAAGSDGTLVVGGDFRVVNDELRYNIARLRADGTLDPAFNPSAWLDGAIYGAAVQDDGKVLVGGAFGVVNGQSRPYLARFYSNGSFDETFKVGTGPNNYAFHFVKLTFGDLLVAGAFSSFDGDTTRYGLVKLFSDGSMDRTFNPRFNNGVYAVALQGDGKILVGGDFTMISGVVRNRIARLFPDGSVDPTFDPGAGANATVRTLAIQPDGRILLSGAFTSPNTYLARLENDGAVDASFKPTFNGDVYVVALGLGGNIHVGGLFTKVDGLDLPYYVRLTPDGQIDPDFNTNLVLNGPVINVMPQQNGKTVLAGAFTQIAGITRHYLARLNEAANAPISITRISVTQAGTDISGTGGSGQNRILEFSSDLRSWLPLLTNSTPGDFTFRDPNLSSARRFYRISQK